MTIAEALLQLRPGAEWVERGGVIEWLDEHQTEPSAEEIQQHIDAHDYREKRAAEYPPIAELADALVHKENGDDSHYEAYVAACEAVKAKYPKS